MAPVGHTNRLLESRFLKSPYNDKLQFRIDILLKSNNPYLIKYFTSSASSTWKRNNMKPRPRLRLLNTSRRAHVAALALGLITWVGNPAAAVLTWQNPGTGNWFDGVNWDASGNVPGVSDAALILNGGTAQAGSTINPSSLTVGTTSNTEHCLGQPGCHLRRSDAGRHPAGRQHNEYRHQHQCDRIAECGWCHQRCHWELGGRVQPGPGQQR
jgi:hypothetical protein